MSSTDALSRYTAAARALEEHEHRTSGERLVASLNHGLTTLRNLFFKRIHEDVETNLGPDSMLMPFSAMDLEKRAKVEIEIYQTVVGSLVAERQKYVQDAVWYRNWLADLRLGEYAADPQVQRRMAKYLGCNDDERRRLFSIVLESTAPEATRAPLVLYRLMPLGIGIVTSVAFGAVLDAAEQRNRQISWLPVIADCHDCHGRALDNGEFCPGCGNPVWHHRWLTSLD